MKYRLQSSAMLLFAILVAAPSAGMRYNPDSSVALIRTLQPHPLGSQDQPAADQDRDLPQNRKLLGPGRLAVDSILLKNGKRYCGLILSGNQQTGVEMLIERGWMQDQHPNQLDALQAVEAQQQQKAYQQIIDRVEDWIAERQADRALVVFLEDELNRIRTRLAEKNVAGSRFMYVSLAASKIRKIYAATAVKRQVVIAALDNDLPDVWYRAYPELVAELKKLQVDVASATFDFSTHVPALEQDEKQWNARKAVIEFDYRQDLEFQGTGSLLFKKGEHANISELIMQIARQQRLGGLPGPVPAAWYQQAIDEADAKGILGVRATRLLQDPDDSILTVQSLFLAKHGNEWIPVVTLQSRASTRNQNADQIGKLAQDPQVRQVLQLLGGNADGRLLQTAMLHGAATEQALAELNHQFNAFLDSYTNRVDAPKLLLSR